MYYCPTSPHERRYVVRMIVMAGLCILFSVVAAEGFRRGHPAGIVAYLLGALPALPIIGALAVTGLYLEAETDEFLRNVFIQSLLGGIGATLALTTVWGNLEDYAHAPHLGLSWLYPLFWAFSGVSYGIVKLRYK